MAKTTRKTRPVRAELVVRIASVDQLRRRMDKVETALEGVNAQLGHLRTQIDALDTVARQILAETVGCEGNQTDRVCDRHPDGGK